jgi:hypothetical protein
MHRRAHALVSLIGLLAVTSTSPSGAEVAAQQIRIQGQRPMAPRPGPRDNQAPQTGTARLRGRVVGGESGQALRRAIVRLQGQEFREGRVASTDEEGAWEIKDLPAGRYNLSASKGGYVQLNYGQRRPFERGRPLELADGQTLENVNFNLPRGSVIAGRIVDEFGEPIADAMVSALHYRTFSGRRRLVPVGRFGSTDDMGHFRLYGLAPGDYYISATLRPMGMMGIEATDVTTSYAPTYYPGTASSQQADRVSVGLGAEMSGITFSLLPVRTVKVSGTAVDSSGKPMAGAFVMLREDVRSGDGGMMMMFGGAGNRVRDDGTFVLPNIAPGDYVLEARTMGMMGPRGRDDDPEAAFTSISVGGEDVTGVTLMGTKGTSLRGQVVVQPAAAATGIKPTDVSVNAMAKNPDAPMVFMGGEMRDRLDDDWTFELKAVLSPVLIRTFRVPSGYSLKAVLLNGADVTDIGVAFKPGEPVTGLQVVLSTTSSGVAGSVTDDNGKPVVDYAAIVFSEDPSKWGYMSRHVTMARPDQQGGFQAKNLPPGRYLAVAVEALEEGQETDPEFLERLRSLATPFGLAESEQRSVSLKIVQAY